MHYIYLGPMKRSGFTLLELSITIIAISMLIGGVLAYNSLRQRAEIQGVLDDLAKYQHAIKLFEEKYHVLPGDMPNATSLWGIAAGTGNNVACYNMNSRTLANPRQTCNGNGDGLIEAPQPAAVGGYGNLWYVAERWRAWQHLSNAQLIEGSYAGTNNGANNNVYSSLNAPETAMSGVFSLMAHLDHITAADPNHYESVATGNQLVFSTDGDKQVTYLPKVFFRMDEKIDDGLPAQGRVTTYKKSSPLQPDCTTSDAIDGAYDVTNRQKKCSILFFSLDD